MHLGTMLHLTHVAGKQMMAQGTDGLSRGMMSQGVMKRVSMSNFVPLHLNPVERQGVILVKWVHSWCKCLGKFTHPRIGSVKPITKNNVYGTWPQQQHRQH